MQIDVIPCVNESRYDEFINKTVIAVDVLRATSTIVTALSNGCKGIIPVETVCQAKNLQENGDLLAGERYCKKITGFDLGNSPFEFMTPEIEGKRIVMTTTNGTRALHKSGKATYILAGAMLNAAACADAVLKLKKDIVILCAGTKDEFSLEDGLCAGLIIEETKRRIELSELNDFAMAMNSAFLHNQGRIEEAILQCSNGKRLCKMGLKEDVLYCAKMNFINTVPFLSGDVMIPYEF
jgi:2-phosphosulfolactate phosphatase